jgi:chromosome segregation ATPase
MEHIVRIINIIDENEKKEKSLSNRILHFFLGKKQKFGEYRTDLDKLRETGYGFIEKAELQEKIERLNKILADVIKDAEQITEENRKAGIQENIINKQKEKLALEAELSAKETEAANAKDEHQKLSDSFYAKGYIKKGDSLVEFGKELEKQLETLKNEKKGELARLEKLLAGANKSAENGGDTTVKEIEKEIEEVNAAKNSDITEKKDELAHLEKSLADAKKSAENKATAIKEIEKQIEEINTAKNSAIDGIEQKLNETKETRKNPTELKLKYQKLENDVNSLKKGINAKTREIVLLDDQLKNTGTGKDEEQKKGSVLASMKPGGKAVSNRTDSLQPLGVPPFDRLPAKGELYRHEGQDYLAIEYWEDYNEGKKEAGRLEAKLCAKGGK